MSDSMMTGDPKGILARNVLVFPYGSEISNEIIRALVHNKHFRLILATSDEEQLGVHAGREVQYLPHVMSPEFDSAVRNLIVHKSISFVIPAHDDVALALSEMDMPDECKVIGQNRATNRTVRYKKATYQSLQGIVPVPQTFTGPEQVEYPVFVKPDRGQGSKHASLVKCSSSMEEVLKGLDPDDFVFSEHLPDEL